MREATVRCVAAVCKTAPQRTTTQVQLLPRIPSGWTHPQRARTSTVALSPRSPTEEASVLGTEQCRCNSCRGDISSSWSVVLHGSPRGDIVSFAIAGWSSGSSSGS
jgi:hypothetical protein